MSSIAFIDEEEEEDNKITKHNNLMMQSENETTDNLKIFNDTVASDLAELIAEIAP